MFIKKISTILSDYCIYNLLLIFALKKKCNERNTDNILDRGAGSQMATSVLVQESHPYGRG